MTAPRTYRDWQLNGWEYGRFTATHVDFDASWEGDEDGWVGSHPTLDGRTEEELLAAIDDWHDEQECVA
ncbi:hypothetical protein Pan3_45 [Pseudanabaena phage Pan3]|nr:hypothetical protein Pan3_45 [Pseudanabaena phage Pan3]